MDLKNFQPLWDLENFLPLPVRADGIVNFPASVGLRKFLSSFTTRRRTCKFFRPLWDLENFLPLPLRAEGLVKFSASVGLRKFLASTTTRRWNCKFSGLCGT